MGYDEYNNYIVGKTIKKVSAKIDKFPLPNLDHAENLESHLQDIISLMDVGSNEEAKMLGIYGGTHRSTIAQAVCNSVARHFEDLWYFYGVYEIARGDDCTWDH